MKCSVCEGTQFTSDEGLQVCSDCGTLVDEFLELETQDYLNELDVSCLTRIKKKKVKPKKENRSSISSNYELYDDMLREWAKALCIAGASSRFEKLLLELWILYLQRLGVAFKPENMEETSKDKDSSEVTVVLNERYPYTIHLTKGESGNMAKRISQAKPTLQCFDRSNVIIDENFLKVMLSLMYLAVLLAEEPILLMDIIRWCLEGQIPYLSAHNLVAEEDRTRLDVKSTRIMWPTAFGIKTVTESLILYMNIQYLPCPPLKHVMDRILKLLKLPGHVGSLAMEHMKDIMKIQSSMPVVGIELYAMSAIIIVVKAHWGLNDVDEVYLSRAAKRLNAELGKKKKVHFFSWEDWEIYMNKLIWFCGEIDPITRMQCRNMEDLSKLNAEVYSEYLWTEGIWRFGAATKLKGVEKQTRLMAEKLLHAQNTSLDNVLNQDVFKAATKEPFYSVIEQFIRAHDNEPEYSHQVKIGRELLKDEFSATTFHLPSLKVLRKELRAVGSGIEVGDTLESGESNSKDYIYIPQPLKTYRKPKLKDGDTYENSLTKVPASFKWFVTICCFFCGTNQLSRIIDACEDVILNK